ncbi:protein SMALL AUXIN UP-REGULATED RNA 51-like [Cornus florida]|uniref:protein SMALL AUXIN UP-REGULATED RNA 51-like n=1 Tax=Cornus florida TaxID=4283 RepID=UPI00289F0249|nr:protein SMALL AUXIN UP-REGULATED RNA 51-like [Cornus florida]
MSSAIKTVNKIIQIVRLKRVVQRWKNVTLNHRAILPPSDSDSSSDTRSTRPTPPGSLAVYVGAERCRFVIPTRFLKLPVFVSLLDKAEEEFGYQSDGGLVLPCEVGFFREVLKLLEKDEHRFGRLGLDDFLSVVSLDSCKDTNNASTGFSPLLQKTSV